MFKEASEKKLVTYEGDPTKLSAHFLEEIYKPQKSGLYVQKAERKKKNYQATILYLAKLFLKNEGEREIKTFADKQKLRDFITTRPALQKYEGETFKLKQKNTRQQHKSI